MSKPNKVAIITVVLLCMAQNPFLDLLSQVGGAIGHMYRVGLRGDKETGRSGREGEVYNYTDPKGNSYATDDIGRKVPFNPIGFGGKAQPQVPQIAQVQALEPAPQRILDVGKHQGMSKTPIPLPSQEIQDILWELMPNEATQSAVAMAGENGDFNINAINDKNANGTIDFGLMQNNSGTLDELLSKPMFGNPLRRAGINRPEDVLGDARKSIIASKVNRDFEDAPIGLGDTNGRPDWSSWYGWQNKGYDMFPDQGVEKTAQNPAYFKLKEYIDNNR